MPSRKVSLPSISENQKKNTLINFRICSEVLITDFNKLDSSIKPTKTVKLQLFRHLIFSNDVSQSRIRKHLAAVHEGVEYVLSHLKGPSRAYLQTRKITLQSDHIKTHKSMKTLVLDLDETLIHCCPLTDNPDRVVACSKDLIPFKIRPYTQEFLRNMANYFEIIVFTSASDETADAIVNELDPNQNLIRYILDRSYCLSTEGGFLIKDLRVIGNRNLKDMVIVDNMVHSFGFQLGNGVPILSWKGNQKDLELKYLQEYLKELSKCEDVTQFNKEHLQLQKFAKINIDDVLQCYV